jgi:hypothetical protein
MYVIKCFEFVSKLGDVSLFIDHSLSGIEHKEVREEPLRRWMDGVPELVRDERLYEKKVPEEIARKFEKQMEESFSKKFDKSGLIALNMSLVMLCTIVEVFLDQMLRTIFDANPRTLLTISPYKNITFEQLLSFKDYAEVIEDFKRKFLEHFNRQEIDEKLDTLYKLGLKKEQLFSWAMLDPEAQRRFAGLDDKHLVDIYEKRHAIVHNDVFSINTIDDLLKIKDFLTKVVFNFSFEAANKFKTYGIVTDIQVMAQGMMKTEAGGLLTI